MGLSVFIVLLCATAMQAAPITYVAEFDATGMNVHTMSRYGVPAAPEQYLIIWDSVPGATGTLWVESIDRTHVSPTAGLVTATGNHNGVPALLLSGWLRFDPALAQMIYAESFRSLVFVTVDGGPIPAPGGGLSPAQHIPHRDLTFSGGGTLSGWGVVMEEDPGGQEPDPVPEPGSWAMMAAGVAALRLHRMLYTFRGRVTAP